MTKTNSATKIPAKDEGLLVTFARTIGSTLGTVAARTGVTKPVRRRTAVKTSRAKSQKTRRKMKT
jgi:hypothetical protein